MIRTLPLATLLFGALAGCVTDTGGGTDLVIPADLDGDGTPNELDCDDARADVFPGSPELPNGVDDDCDGTVDNGTERYDDDGDGFTELAGDCDDANRDVYPGRAEIPYDGVDQDCSLGDLVDVDHDSYAATEVGGDDCDDERAEVNPAGVEVANGLDDNCDGTADEGTTLFDDDRDGFSEVDGDCDDDNRQVHPDAVEIKYDGVDNDCDGFDLRDVDVDGQNSWEVGGNDCDDDDPLVFEGAPEIPYDGLDQDCDGKDSADFDGDGYDSVVVLGGTDCDDGNIDVNPGRSEIGDYLDNDCDDAVDENTEYGDDDLDGYAEIAGDCDDALPDINPGEVEICGDGMDQNCDGSTNGCGIGGDMNLVDADVRLNGSASYDYAGWSVDGAGDATGDGALDYFVTAYGADSNGYDAGSAVLVSGDATSGALTTDGLSLKGERTYDYAGYSAHGGGDLDGDGQADVYVGARDYDVSSWYSAGRGYAFYGPVTASQGLNSADFYLEGSASYVYTGVDGVVAGDLTDTGNDDLAIGAYGSYVGSYYYAGEVYVVEGGSSSGSASSIYDARIQGQYSYGYLGWSVAHGDWNGDGVGDVASGAYGDGTGGSYSGSVFTFYGPLTGSYKSTDADTQFVGPASSAYLGYGLANGQDVSGDGTDDFLTGAYYVTVGSFYGAGAAYYFESPLSSGKVYVSSSSTASFTGEATYDYAGRAVALPGDVNGDGNGDFLIGAYGADGGGSYAGAAYLVFGPVTGANDLGTIGVGGATLDGEAASSYAGSSVGAPGDIDEDGEAEILVGAYYNKEGSYYGAGAGYLLYGGVGL